MKKKNLKLIQNLKETIETQHKEIVSLRATLYKKAH